MVASTIVTMSSAFITKQVPLSQFLIPREHYQHPVEKQEQLKDMEMEEAAAEMEKPELQVQLEDVRWCTRHSYNFIQLLLWWSVRGNVTSISYKIL